MIAAVFQPRQPLQPVRRDDLAQRSVLVGSLVAEKYAHVSEVGHVGEVGMVDVNPRAATDLRGDNVTDIHPDRLPAKPAPRLARRPGEQWLRHTFWSHLAMHGASARAIQALVGQADLSTVQR